jgi:hypothetical protein
LRISNIRRRKGEQHLERAMPNIPLSEIASFNVGALLLVVDLVAPFIV